MVSDLTSQIIIKCYYSDRFGSLLTSWSSRDSLNLKKDGHNLEDDDDLMNQKGKIVLLGTFIIMPLCTNQSTIGAKYSSKALHLFFLWNHCVDV